MFPSLAWGRTVLHVLEDAIRVAVAAIIRMTRMMMNMFRAEPDTWLSSHVQSWQSPSSALVA